MTKNNDVYNVTYTMGAGYKSKTQEENEDLFFEALNRQRASEEKSKAAYLESQRINRENYEKGIKTFPDSVVKQIVSEHLKRAQQGFVKYDETLDRNDLTLVDWLQHTKEELMDAVLYIEKTIQVLKGNGKV
jgi:ATP-dependent Zn protease